MNEKETLKKEIEMNAMVAYRIECTICGETTESEGDFMAGDEDAEMNGFQNELYDDGWRVFASKEYGQTGITCPDCQESEGNEQAD